MRVRPELRQMITYKQLNLLGDHWPLTGQFDVIFCRNVMIYFDKPTQRKILARFVPLMKPDALAVRRPLRELPVRVRVAEAARQNGVRARSRRARCRRWQQSRLTRVRM